MDKPGRVPRSPRGRMLLLFCLPGLALLLSSCAPSVVPTGLPTAPSPTPSPTPSPVQPTALPTWTALPAPTAAPSPTPTPTLPPPLPTPTPAPPLNPTMQVGAFFFFWHNCPQENCYTDLVYAVPPGWSEPFPQDPDPSDGRGYSSLNRYWYAQELRDMQLAGVDIVLPVSWGEHPFPWFRTRWLVRLVEANRELGSPLKIGLFDDTTSEVCEYRDYADNGRLDNSSYFGTGPALDLRQAMSGFFFYDRKIRPFFQTIPQEMWATHDGRPVEEGGRPLIVVYGSWGMSHLEKAGELWRAVKEAFARDFHDSQGRPITPWIVLEDSWFTESALQGEPSLEEVADGRYVWGSALLGPRIREWHGYTVASVGPGFDDRKLKGEKGGREQPRWVTPGGEAGGPDAFLRASFSLVPPHTNLLLIETWNELWEGTSVERAGYPEMAGKPVPEDPYLDTLRQVLRGQKLWWSAKLLPPARPLRVAAGHRLRLTLPVQNVGARSWSRAGGERLVLEGALVPGGEKELFPPTPVRPGEIAAFTTVITAPAAVGTYTLTWRMVGPEGAFSPEASWSVAVEPAVLSTTVRVQAPVEPVVVGESFTLSVGLAPPVSVVAVRFSARFDPAFLRLEEMEPLLARPLLSWNVQVDNERGVGVLECRGAAEEAALWLGNLRWTALQAGEGGVWIEQVQLWTEDGELWTVDSRWVPLTAVLAGQP